MSIIPFPEFFINPFPQSPSRKIKLLPRNMNPSFLTQHFQKGLPIRRLKVVLLRKSDMVIILKQRVKGDE